MNLSTLFRRKPLAKILADAEASGEFSAHGLKKTLGVWDLTAFGVAAIIGAGIFSTVGAAAAQGGPAVSLLFVFTAVACGFSALCYAQFASTIPVSGSAYTYAYATLGELVAWIIGWDIAMEYAIGNIAVAISWSDYFTAFLAQYHMVIPEHFTMDYLSAKRGFEAARSFMESGLGTDQMAANNITQVMVDGYKAYIQAPRPFGIPMIMDLPALGINVFTTWIVYLGIRESKRIANVMVVLKTLVVMLVILVGVFYIKPENWKPFAPNGLSGVLKGVSAVFFAYIGFDAIATTAEECRDPKRDLPRSMFYSLFICTVLYILISLVLTGVVPYAHLNVGDPLAYVFGPEGANIPWISAIVSGSAVIALFTVFLVFQLGQPRIWMVMGRDGLLPKKFAQVHPKYGTPAFGTLITGVLVGIPCLFMNLTEVTDLTSIGTLFAFLIVCCGALFVDDSRARFKVPYINGRWSFPIIYAVVLYYVCTTRMNFQGWSQMTGDQIILLIYFVFMTAVTVLAVLKQWSLIPLMGIMTCSYLMTELGVTNWLRFGIWLALGLVVYCFYGIRKSELARSTASNTQQ